MGLISLAVPGTMWQQMRGLKRTREQLSIVSWWLKGAWSILRGDVPDESSSSGTTITGRIYEATREHHLKASLGLERAYDQSGRTRIIRAMASQRRRKSLRVITPISP